MRNRTKASRLQYRTVTTSPRRRLLGRAELDWKLHSILGGRSTEKSSSFASRPLLLTLFHDLRQDHREKKGAGQKRQHHDLFMTFSLALHKFAPKILMT